MQNQSTIIPIQTIQTEIIYTRKYKAMRRLLNTTGLCFRGDSKMFKFKTHTLRLIIALILVGLVIYQLGTYVFFLLNLEEYNSRISRTLVMSLWVLKALFSMLFLFYWEIRGYNQHILEHTLCLRQQDPSSLSHNDRTTQLLLICFMTVTLITSILCTGGILANKFGYTDVDFIVFDILMIAYGHGIGSIILLIINLHAFLIFNIVLVFFIVTTLSIRLHIVEFVNKLKIIGRQKEHEPIDNLFSLYNEYRAAIRTIRETNNTFEVYTFISIGTNIPLMIFTMLTLQMNVNRNWMDIVYSIPEIVFVFVEMFSLTFSPAAIQNALSEIEPIIYENERIWVPYEHRSYEIANLYINMAKQSNLGVTVWGFAILNKPLILTTASIVITYFTLIVQLGYGSESQKTISTVNSTMYNQSYYNISN